MKMRNEQIDAFSRSREIAYEDSLISHIRDFFPDRFQTAGETNVRELIRYGIMRSRSYGIVTERDVCKYIDLMIVFGRDFDQECVWAQEILTDEDADPVDQIDDLYEVAQFIEEG